MELSEITFLAFARAVAAELSKFSQTPQRLLSLEEAAQYLGLSEDSVRDLVNQGKLKPIRPTRKLQFDIRDLDAFIDEQKRIK